MNCSLALGALGPLLGFLANQLYLNQFILQAGPEFSVGVVKSVVNARHKFRLSFRTPFAPDTDVQNAVYIYPPDANKETKQKWSVRSCHHILVSEPSRQTPEGDLPNTWCLEVGGLFEYFGTGFIALKQMKINAQKRRGIPLLLADGCSGPLFASASDNSLIAEMDSESCCKLFMKMPGSPEFQRIAHSSIKRKKWFAVKRILKESALETDLSNVTLNLVVSTISTMENSAALRAFSSSLQSLYWSLIVQHFHIKLQLVLLRQPPGEANFNNLEPLTTALKENKSVDVIGSLLILSSERAEVFAYILVGLDVKYHFIIRRPEYVSSYFALLRPLEIFTWYCLMGMVVIVGLAFYILLRRPPGISQSVHFNLSLFTAFGFSCNQVNLATLKNLSSQIACISALLFFFTVHQFYVSNLYTILSTKEIYYPFNTMEEFVEKNNYRLVMHPETSAYKIFQASKQGTTHAIWEKFIQNDPSHKINGTNFSEKLERICKGNTAIFAIPQQVSGYKTPECPLQAVPTGYFPIPMGLVTRKDFPYLKIFRSLFLRSSEAGIASYQKKKYVSKMMPPLKKTDLQVDPLPVTLYQVLFPCVVFAAAVALSIVILTAEILHFKNFKSKKQ